MLFTIYEINIVIQVWCAAFSVVCLLCVALFGRTTHPASPWYRLGLSMLFLLNIISALAGSLAAISHGQPGVSGTFGVLFGSLVSDFALFFMAVSFTSYMCSRLEEGGATGLGWWISTTYAAALVGAALAAVGTYFNFASIDVGISSAYLINLARFVGVAILVGDLCVLVANARCMSSPSVFSSSVCCMLPTFALIANQALNGVDSLIVATTVSLLILFVDVQAHLAELMADQEEQIALRERELTESRVQIMVSQIQPHFLYNTLDSIYYLCGKNPIAAREAISKFSDYLRGNLKSLGEEKPVPFERELEHVTNYLELEQMSSDDTIRFEVDAQVRDFELPALSLQPVVENAVKHGLGQKLGGGTVTLATREEGGNVVITVSDDGAGFDTSVPPSTDRPHVGIQNVRNRVASMCRGTVDVASNPGEGTVVTMTIPRKAA